LLSGYWSFGSLGFEISLNRFELPIECDQLLSEEAHVIDQAIKPDFDHIGAADGHR
jgi:hypothetical protein